jgi:hypothetical protein
MKRSHNPPRWLKAVFTEESWALLLTAVAQANAILEADPLTICTAQDDVNSPRSRCTRAIAGLEERPVFVEVSAGSFREH